MIHIGVVIIYFPYLEEELRQIERLDIDSVFLKCDFIKTHCLESSGSCSDTSYVESFHAIHNTTDGRKILEILCELLRQRMHNVRL